MAAKKQAIAILFAVFLIMLCLSVKARTIRLSPQKFRLHCIAIEYKNIEMNLPPIFILSKDL